MKSTSNISANQDVTRIFWSLIVLTFAIKIYLAYLVPITGDEAEYVYWSQHLAWGYYDHPPMIAWLLYPFSAINLSNIWLRLPQIFTSTLISILIAWLLKPFDTKKAYLIAILYLISPVGIFNQAILTDTPLALFTFLSVAVLFMAIRKSQARTSNPAIFYLLAGFLLGAAYLSKYLMFPVALAIFIFFLLPKTLPNKWRNFGWFLLGVTPFFLQNIIWNYNHDWVNFLFNLNLRNVTTVHFGWQYPLLFLLSIIYLYSPIVIYYTGKHIKILYHKKTNNTFSLFILCTFIPIIFYGLLSLIKKIGLHWIFCAYPFLFTSLFIILNTKQLKKCILFMSIYTGIQLLIIIIAFQLPLSVWQKTPYYDKINWFLNVETVAEQINPYLNEGFILATPSYAQSYLLGYKKNIETIDWGKGSVHGRQVDLSVDFKTLDKKNILLVDLHQKLNLLTDIKPYFKLIRIQHLAFNNTPYRIIFGYQFNYPKYRDKILKAINEKYYQTPNWLPQSKAYFKKKYWTIN